MPRSLITTITFAVLLAGVVTVLPSCNAYHRVSGGPYFQYLELVDTGRDSRNGRLCADCHRQSNRTIHRSVDVDSATTNWTQIVVNLNLPPTIASEIKVQGSESETFLWSTFRMPTPGTKFSPSSSERDQSMRDSVTFYEQSLRKSRTRIKMRDSDIVLASFPKSGTHWLAKVLSELLRNTTTKYVETRATAYDRNRARLEAVGKWNRSAHPPVWPVPLFHNLPVFVPFPDARKLPVPEEAYRLLEEIPDDIPRIFLTHQPVAELEYDLAPGTRVIYMLRDPHAACASLYRFYRRYVDDHGINSGEWDRKIDTFILDFIGVDGLGVRFPARMENPSQNAHPYIWSTHVNQWYEFALTRQKGTSKFMDFHADVRSDDTAAARTVSAMASWLLNPAAAAKINVQSVLKASSLENTIRKVTKRHDDGTYHFGRGSTDAWKADFALVDDEQLSRWFEEQTAPTYAKMTRRRKITSLKQRAKAKSSSRKPLAKVYDLWV